MVKGVYHLTNILLQLWVFSFHIGLFNLLRTIKIWVKSNHLLFWGTTHEKENYNMSQSLQYLFQNIECLHSSTHKWGTLFDRPSNFSLKPWPKFHPWENVTSLLKLMQRRSNRLILCICVVTFYVNVNFYLLEKQYRIKCAQLIVFYMLKNRLKVSKNITLNFKHTFSYLTKLHI